MPKPRGPEYHLEDHRRPSRQPYRLWNNARQRASRKDLPFTITLEWVKERMAKGVCEATGVPLGPILTATAPSLDQLVPAAGYTPDNTRLTTRIYNNAKNQFDHEDVVSFAMAVVSHERTSHG